MGRAGADRRPLRRAYGRFEEAPGCGHCFGRPRAPPTSYRRTVAAKVSSSGITVDRRCDHLRKYRLAAPVASRCDMGDKCGTRAPGVLAMGLIVLVPLLAGLGSRLNASTTL